jgi:hypothetical protein
LKSRNQPMGFVHSVVLIELFAHIVQLCIFLRGNCFIEILNITGFIGNTESLARSHDIRGLSRRQTVPHGINVSGQDSYELIVPATLIASLQSSTILRIAAPPISSILSAGLAENSSLTRSHKSSQGVASRPHQSGIDANPFIVDKGFGI